MIEIRVANGKFEVKGTFNFGYMGIYRDEQISILDNVEEVRDWDIIQERLNTKTCTADEIAACLTDYFNNFEVVVRKNIKQINDNFLLKMYEDMEACGAEFWEIDEITIKEAMPSNVDKIYQPHWDEMSKVEKEYEDSPNDGSVEKTDVEETLKRLFPMLNWDKLIEEIIPEHMGLSDGYVSFQCSDNLGYKILCSAYDDLDERLRFTDWHNF